MRRLYILFLTVMAVILCVSFLSADQTTQDMYATVTVNKTFALSLDNALIDFGYVEPGKSIELSAGMHYNEVRCRANKGTVWNLKISILNNVIGPGGKAVSPDIFKWRIANFTGDGQPQDGWNAFSADPKVVYTSGQNDARGEEVVIKFRYKMDLPQDALSGTYRVRVVYTLTDNP